MKQRARPTGCDRGRRRRRRRAPPRPQRVRDATTPPRHGMRRTEAAVCTAGGKEGEGRGNERERVEGGNGREVRGGGGGGGAAAPGEGGAPRHDAMVEQAPSGGRWGRKGAGSVGYTRFPPPLPAGAPACGRGVRWAVAHRGASRSANRGRPCVPLGADAGDDWAGRHHVAKLVRTTRRAASDLSLPFIIG